MSEDKHIERIFIEEGWEVTQISTKLLENVYLHVIDGTEASLTVGNQELEFTYDSEVKRLFERLDEGATARELLAFLSRQ